MSSNTEPQLPHRAPLTADQVLRAAVGLADREGIEAVTMRGLAREVGVEAMSLYHHVANKEAVLDGMVDVIVGEILTAVDALDRPSPEPDWKSAMRSQILTARRVLLRHPWAPAIIETRSNMSPTIITYFETVLGTFRAGGFSWDLAHHAMHALGSRALGFTQELFEPGEGGDAEAMEALAQMADRLPNLVGMMQAVAHDDPDSTLGWCDDDAEFQFGLDLLLDGLERHNASA
jgi:AcrR family transcriptional regulator